MARRRVRDLCPGESHPGPKVPDWQQHRSPTPDLGRTMGRGRTFGTRAGGVETIAFGWAQIAVRCNMICGVISEDLRRLTMTQTPEKTESRWAELSDEVLESVEASRKQAIDAIRKFVDQVSGEISPSGAAQERHRRGSGLNRGVGHRADRVLPQRSAKRQPSGRRQTVVTAQRRKADGRTVAPWGPLAHRSFITRRRAPPRGAKPRLAWHAAVQSPQPSLCLKARSAHQR